jgi:hypothetical protein
MRLPADERDASAPFRNNSNHGRFRYRIGILLFSALLVVPCFWQSRIQSADLGSHIYNAWLVSQIRIGALPGLWVSPRFSNVLFDVVLEWLLVHVGVEAAQRIAVSAAVLIFAWGALLFIFRVGKKNYWFAAPCVAMLAYGFIFHIGFFNFYLAMGLCLWYVAFFWNGSWMIRAAALPLLLMAWIAHPMPVVWSVGLCMYVVLARRLGGRNNMLLLIVGIAALISLHYVLTHRYPYSWSAQQGFFVTGANQITLFGVKYFIPFACLLFIWLKQVRQLLKQRHVSGLFAEVPFQLWVLNAVAVALIPNQLLLPQFARELGFITTRLSFCGFMLLCGVLSTVPLTRFDKIALLATCALFFAFLYSDESKLNRIENRIDAAIHTLPRMQRVIAKMPGQSLAWLCFLHDVDRACIGRCFSYGNYEPSSGQFWIHAQPDNGVVLSDHLDVDAVRAGSYITKQRDLPIYLVYRCGADLENVCSRPLGAGEISGKAN